MLSLPIAITGSGCPIRARSIEPILDRFVENAKRARVDPSAYLEHAAHAALRSDGVRCLTNSPPSLSQFEVAINSRCSAERRSAKKSQADRRPPRGLVERAARFLSEWQRRIVSMPLIESLASAPTG